MTVAAAPVPRGVLAILVLTWSLALGQQAGFTSATGLLMGRLFTFKNSACDQDMMHIRCPHGTTISVQFAQYGRLLPPKEMCQLIHIRPDQPHPPQNINCIAPSSLQVVMDVCQDQRQCKLLADVKTFGKDPCADTSKYLEVAYKCRPNEFLSRITCEGEEMLLKCPKSKRLAIYSASFGSSNEGDVQCPAKDKTEFTGECQARKVLQKVNKLCFGRRHCSIRSDEHTFGKTCDVEVTKVLNVVYTCVPRRLLKKKGYPDPEPGGNDREGELKENIGVGIEGGQPSLLPKHSTYNFSDLQTTTSATYQQSTKTNDPCMSRTSDAPGNSSFPNTVVINPMIPCVTLEPRAGAALEEDEYLGFITDWMKTYAFLEENREKLILYVVISLLTGLTLLLLFIVVKLLYDRRQSDHRAKLDVTDSVPAAEDTSHSTNASLTYNASRSQNSSNRDSVLDTSSERNDNIDLIHYNVRTPPPRQPTLSRPAPNALGRTSHNTLSRPAPSTLSRVHFEEPPSSFMSDPEYVRSTIERDNAHSLFDLDSIRITRDLDHSRPTPSYSNFYR